MEAFRCVQVCVRMKAAFCFYMLLLWRSKDSGHYCTYGQHSSLGDANYDGNLEKVVLIGLLVSTISKQGILEEGPTEKEEKIFCKMYC